MASAGITLVKVSGRNSDGEAALINWLFFDVGDVLLDENAPHYLYYHSLLLAMRRHGIDVRWDDYLARINAIARERPAAAVVEAARFYVPDAQLFDEIYHAGRGQYLEVRKPRPFGMLLNGIEPVVRSLATRFKLGVIANQHPAIVGALDDYGIGPLFKEIIIDEIVGVAKPDPAIFRLALKRAGCVAGDALMIGDRPDNDIAPARSVGMKTLRFRRGVLYSLYQPKNAAELPDGEVTQVDKVEAAIRALTGR
jgi:HAD superfamily hydrolase (TIGR01549 family)